MASVNEHTGASMVAGGFSKEGEKQFEAIFGSEWRKHPEIEDAPVSLDVVVEIETWNSRGTVIKPAGEIDWRYVRRYRVAPAKK